MLCRLPRVALAATALVLAAAATLAQQKAPAALQGAELLRSQQNPDVLPLAAVAYTEVDRINLGAVLKEDAQRELEGLPPRFAISNEVDISPATHGTWEDLDAERLLWRLRVRGFGAKNLNLGFDTYYMPRGGELWLYSADMQHVVRPFTAEDNASHGELWTPVVGTDELVIELIVPRRAVDDFKLHLSYIGYGYRGFKSDPPAPTSGSCNYDVICPEGDDWRLDIPSVGVISLGGGTFCTGYMVNNARTDLAPYFMTAFHCGVNSGNAASLVVYWNYENTTCRPAGSSSSGGSGDGTLNQFNTGSFFRAEYQPSDVTLVLLDSDPDPGFDVSFAGWDNSGTDASEAIAIHQPNTDEKRISFEFEPTTTTSYLGEDIPGDATHVRVTDWDLGTTEPGSSGSPLFNQDHRIIGQLHGGFASCSSQTSDWYGRFSLSWTGGGTAATRISDWLDPDNTGVTFVDTVSLSTLCTDQGEITLGAGRYNCEDSVSVRVVDCGLNLNPGVVDTVMISVSSTSEGGGEALLLTETSAGSARFQGSIPVSGTDAVGTVLVGEGDMITASYIDADDGLGGINVPVAINAVVDCTLPVISNVTVFAIDATSAMLRVTADEAIAAVADFGSTACGSYPRNATGAGLQTTNTVELDGLSPGVTYFVRAGALDEAGNLATDDNGGGCYSFTTDDVPDYNTEEFLGDMDLANRSWLLTPGPGEYSLCSTGGIASLPTDPSGDTVLSMSDDDSELINITGGRTVRIYDQTYGSIYVGSNGNITFAGPNTDFSESLDDHFSVPRIAVMFDDFNPSSAGTVSYRQYGNRITVTWQGVPEFNTSNTNTFQADLFFGGRIRLSYLTMDSIDGIVGVSDGTGLAPIFIETDISSAGGCVGPGPKEPRESGPPTGSATRTVDAR